MKFKLNQDFPFSLATLLEARERRWDNLDKFPELKNQELLEEKMDGKIRFQKRKLKLGDALPSIIKSVLPAGILEMIEESHYDTEKNIHNFKVFPPGHESTFLITGKTNYVSVNENASRREYELEIKVNVLLVGGTIESQVAKTYKHSLEKDCTKLIEFLKEKNA